MKLNAITIKEKYRKGIAKFKRIVYKTENPIFNLYKKNYQKHALLSYITSPFKIGTSYKHNNTQYAPEITQALDEMGYIVDIINFEDTRKYSYEKYDLIVGFGKPFTESYKTNSKAKRIYYGTTMNIHQNNYQSVKQLQAFHKRHGLWLPESGRIINNAAALQVQAVDGITYYGNKTTAAGFRETFPKGPMHRLHNIQFVIRKSDEVLRIKKNWKKAKMSFIAVSGAGMIHKGFDVLIELFAKHPEWELHLGAPVLNEQRFFDFYKKELALPNIHHYGFIDVNSQLYLDIVDKCAFFLSASASEGCPTTVINACTNGKIVPIATPHSGLEEDDFILPLSEISEKEIEKTIIHAQKITEDELERLSVKAHRYFSTQHSVENYRKELKAALIDITK